MFLVMIGCVSSLTRLGLWGVPKQRVVCFLLEQRVRKRLEIRVLKLAQIAKRVTVTVAVSTCAEPQPQTT